MGWKSIEFAICCHEEVRCNMLQRETRLLQNNQNLGRTPVNSLLSRSLYTGIISFLLAHARNGFSFAPENSLGRLSRINLAIMGLTTCYKPLTNKAESPSIEYSPCITEELFINQRGTINQQSINKLNSQIKIYINKKYFYIYIFPFRNSFWISRRTCQNPPIATLSLATACSQECSPNTPSERSEKFGHKPWENHRKMVI